jgi:phosphate-selective porin
MKMIKGGIVLAGLLLSSIVFAQPPINKKESKDSAKERKVIVSGMLLTRFTQSFNKEIDINGKYCLGNEKYSTSSFSLRRARLQAKAQITPQADAAVLLNLTDFIGNPANKVLENAFIRYHFNNYINLQVGQYRPYFGREDLYPEELLQALEWSNSYYAFGANGWQSFQAGATVFGKVNVFKIPVSYYVGVFNGNGRNQPMDNDNGKLFPARLEIAVAPKTKFGLNGGLGKDGQEKVWACNFDIDHVEKFGERWELEIQSEYKRGTNNSKFDTSCIAGKKMSNYQLEGFYVLPNLKYKINSGQIKSFELSCRYESLNCDIRRNGSTKQTWMPVVSLQLADEYYVRLETGLIIDRYSVASTREHDGTRFVCQMQVRF